MHNFRLKFNIIFSEDGAIGGSIRMGENFGRYEDIEVKITGPDDEEIKKIKRMNGTFDNANLSPILVKTLTVSFI